MALPRGWTSVHAQETERLNPQLRGKPFSECMVGGGYGQREFRYALAEEGITTLGQAVEAGAHQTFERVHAFSREQLGFRSMLSDYSDKAYK
jgi:hypothetical protein